MPDMIPVGNTNYVPPPNSGMDTLQGILGIQQSKQALISGQLDIESQQAGLVAQQQKAKEIAAGVPLMTDPVGNGITDKEGNPTENAYKIIKQAMPMTGDEHYKDILSNATANLQYKNTWMGMSRDVRNDVSARMAAVAADETGGQKAGLPEYKSMLDSIEQDYAGTPAEDQVKKITAVSRDAITKAGQSHGLDGMQHVALAFSRGGLGNAGITGSSGVATPQATTQDQGGQMQPGVTAPALAGGGFTPTGQPNRKTIPPGYMMAPNGSIVRADNIGLTTPTDKTVSPPKSPPTGKLQPLQRPGINAPKADQENYNARIKQSGDEMAAVSGAANDPQNGVQVSRYRNGQILDLTKIAPTGPGKDLWNHFASQFPGEGADAFQKIGHYLAQNSAAMAGKMGVPNTNMGQETAAAAAGNTAQNPAAIKEITKTNDALNTGFDLYNRGLAKVTNNGSDLSKVQSYKQAFGANVDVNALRWADANRRGDREEIESLTKQGPKAIAEWQKKLGILKSLAITGDLP